MSGTPPSPATAAAGPSALDLLEQQERIKNLEADTAQKLKALASANLQTAIAVATVVAALGGVIVAAATLYLDHAAPPRPTYIFLNPSPEKML